MVDFATLILGADTRGLGQGRRDMDDFASGAERTETRTSAAMKRIGGAAGAMAAAMAAALSFRKFIDATVETEKAQAQLASALLSTGNAAGKTIGQLNAHAAAMQKVTNFGADTTNAMQGLLLTFTSIKGTQFDRATEAVLDLATAMGTDLNSAALQVGKALNDPVLGMTALARSGIQFTDAQKDAVKAMVETNNVVGAQTIILKELDKQFGGSAVAARDTLGGALASLGNAWGDLFEISGPAAESLKAAIGALADAITGPAFVAVIQGIGRAIFNALSVAIFLISGVVNAFELLRVAIDLPERAFRSLFGMGETALQTRQAIDQLTLAMGSEIEQIGILTGSMSGGVTISREMAEAKLRQAEAHFAVLEAMRQEHLALITNSAEFKSFDTTLEQMGRTLDGIVNEQRNFAPMFDRGEIEDFLLQMQRVKDQQIALLGDAAALSPAYIAAQQDIERIRSAIEAATGEQITFNGEAITAEDIARRLDAAVDGVSFAVPISGAAELARILGVSLATANALAGLGIGDAAISAGDGRGSQRPVVRDAAQANTDRILARQDAARKAAMDAGTGSGAASSGGASVETLQSIVDMLTQEETKRQSLIGIVDEQRLQAEAYNELVDRMKSSGAEFTEEALRGAAAQIAAQRQLTATMEEQAATQDRVAKGLAGLFKAGLDGADAFKNALAGVISRLAEVLINSAFQSLVGGLGPQATGVLGAIFPSADGNVISDGNIIPFASGGVVSRATMFPMRGGIGLMGEAGPEAIMPLSRGADGKLGVRAGGRGSAMQVTVTMDPSTGAMGAFVRDEAGRVVAQARPAIVSQSVSTTEAAMRKTKSFGGR